MTPRTVAAVCARHVAPLRAATLPDGRVLARCAGPGGAVAYEALALVRAWLAAAKRTNGSRNKEH